MTRRRLRGRFGHCPFSGIEADVADRSDPGAAASDRIAELGRRLALVGMRRNADSRGAEIREGPGWFAVRTRGSDNSSNGVISEDGLELDDEQLRRLLSWVADAGRSASWLLEQPDPALVSRLIAAGGSPERTGNWCARTLPITDRLSESSIDVELVADADQIEHWLRLAFQCGWFGDDSDRRARADALRHPSPHTRYWLAVLDGTAVGFATTVVDDAVVELHDVGVDARARRTGVGSALVRHVLDGAAADGAGWVIAAPSPDGWAMMRTLGFTLAPMTPDLQVYFSPG